MCKEYCTRIRTCICAVTFRALNQSAATYICLFHCHSTEAFHSSGHTCEQGPFQQPVCRPPYMLLPLKGHLSQSVCMGSCPDGKECIPLKVTLRQEIVLQTIPLEDGDTIVFIPPVITIEDQSMCKCAKTAKDNKK